MISKSDINKEFYRVGEISKFVALTSRTIQNYCTKRKFYGLRNKLQKES